MVEIKCPQCKIEMKKVEYDIGLGIIVDSFTCPNCRYNMTKEEVLEKAIKKLREKTSVKIRVVRIGTGIGVRFPNEIVTKFKLKKGEELHLIRQNNQLVIKKADVSAS